MGHESGPFLNDSIVPKEAELTYIAGAVDKTSSMASSVMYGGLPELYIDFHKWKPM